MGPSGALEVLGHCLVEISAEHWQVARGTISRSFSGGKLRQTQQRAPDLCATNLAYLSTQAFQWFRAVPRALLWSWHAAPQMLQIMEAAGAKSRRCCKQICKMQDVIISQGAVQCSAVQGAVHHKQSCSDERVSACLEKVARHAGGQSRKKIGSERRRAQGAGVPYIYLVQNHPYLKWHPRAFERP